MSAVMFVLVALALAVLGSAVLVVRSRKPTSADWSVEEFRREMKALSPELDPSAGEHRHPREQ